VKSVLLQLKAVVYVVAIWLQKEVKTLTIHFLVRRVDVSPVVIKNCRRRIDYGQLDR